MQQLSCNHALRALRNLRTTSKVGRILVLVVCCLKQGQGHRSMSDVTRIRHDFHPKNKRSVSLQRFCHTKRSRTCLGLFRKPNLPAPDCMVQPLRGKPCYVCNQDQPPSSETMPAGCHRPQPPQGISVTRAKSAGSRVKTCAKLVKDLNVASIVPTTPPPC